jgi:L-fuculose-phosphate aldolase
MNLDEVRHDVLAAAKRMAERRLVEGTAGNVSGRVDDGTVVVTPAARRYDDMTLDDLVVVDLGGTVVTGSRRPTSEIGVHLAILAAYPEVGAVLHCHATHASMFAAARQPLPAAIDELVVQIGGDVPVGAYQPSGSDALAVEVATHLADRSAVLMANHGLVTIGPSPSDALHVALVVEHGAEIAWGAAQLGGVVALPPDAVRAFTRVYREARRGWNA